LLNADPKRPHCRSRDDIFAMFRVRMASGTESGSTSCSTPTQVLVTARAAEAALEGRNQATVERWWHRWRQVPVADPGRSSAQQ
jgi:hypothetical protein